MTKQLTDTALRALVAQWTRAALGELVEDDSVEVEDEQRLAYLLRRVLLEERHTVDLAHDGHAGLDLALSDTYDVVILDVMLPGIDGLEICRQMRAEHIMSPVLMLTGRW